MLLEITLALIIGIIAGTLTGLFPGIHINLVAAFLLSSLALLDFVPLQALVVFIVAMSITHIFVDFIPTIFLGAPEEESFLAVLPGHQMLREGKGFEAVILTLYGCLTALPIILIFTFIFIFFLPQVFSSIQKIIPFILIFVSLYLIFREEEFTSAFIIFILSGFLGLFAFNLPVKEPLLPLLTGLFGVSGLIVSIKTKIKIPKQKISGLKEIKLKRSTFLRTTLASAIAAPLCSFLPGIGGGQAAVIGSEIMGKESENKRAFLFLVGAINAIVMSLSFVTAYTIGKTRTGSAAAIKDILGEITLSHISLILLVIFISSVISFFLAIKLAKIFAKNINRFNYNKVSIIVLIILVLVNILLSNFLGLLVLATGSAIGVFAVSTGSRRISLMGCLLIPSIVYYLVF